MGTSATFDEVMGSLDVPMVVVTTVASGERAGCLVGFHVQCSIEPRRYAIWLSKANHTCRVALRARHFAVHFLSEADMDLAVLFGTTSGDDIDKFEHCEWTPGPDGVPLLTGCPRRVVARKVALLDEGSDHVCLVTEPELAEAAGPFRPMRFSRVADLQAGHAAEERPAPPTLAAGERAVS